MSKQGKTEMEFFSHGNGGPKQTRPANGLHEIHDQLMPPQRLNDEELEQIRWVLFTIVYIRLC